VNTLRTYIEQITTIDDRDWEFFSSKLTKREFSKKTKLLNLGETENYISFIEDGIIRLLIPNKHDDL
jgi:hypothetical protein